jgi:ParB-like nuclease domain
MNIAPDLISLAVPVANLTLMQGNPRKGDVEAVKRSYEKFGQRKPIVARRTGLDDKGIGIGIVTAGNHQLQAAKALKWKEIAVVFIDEDENTAKAFSLADNRTHDLGTYDDGELNTLLKEMEAFDKDLFAATGYTNSDIDILLKGIGESTGAEGEPVDDTDRGQLLSLLNVAYGEPKHEVIMGDVYTLKKHILVIADVMKDWDKYVSYLTVGFLFVPYPGPYIALSAKLDKQPSVMVQPNIYLAGHILDKYASIHGEESIVRTHRD